MTKQRRARGYVDVMSYDPPLQKENESPWPIVKRGHTRAHKRARPQTQHDYNKNESFREVYIHSSRTLMSW